MTNREQLVRLRDGLRTCWALALGLARLVGVAAAEGVRVVVKRARG